MAKFQASDKFLKCLIGELSKLKGYGQVRLAKITDEYKHYAERNVEAGMNLNDARSAAMEQVKKDLEDLAIAKKARLADDAKKISEIHNRIMATNDIRTMASVWAKVPLLGRKANVSASRVYTALRSMVEQDIRVPQSESNFVAHMDTAKQYMASMFRETIQDIGYNWLDMRRGSTDLLDVVREIMQPGSSQSQMAKAFAKAYRDSDRYAVSEMNLNGTTIKQTPNEIVFAPAKVKMVNATKAQFVQDMLQKADWTKTGFGRVPQDERADWLGKYYDTHIRQSTEGNKLPIPPESIGGRFVRDFHNDRLIQFRTAEDYMAMHEKYMDGSFIETNMHRIDKLAHNVGVAKTWGGNPVHMMNVYRELAAQAIIQSGDKTAPRGVDRMLRRYTVISDMAMRRNPMDPESTLGMVVSMTSNAAAMAQLGHASLVSIPGDIGTAIANRLRNHEPIMNFLGSYLRAFTSINSKHDALVNQFSTAEMFGHSMVNARFGIDTQYGPYAFKYLADKTMAVSGMNRGFESAMVADKAARAMSLWDQRGKSFADIREVQMLRNNGFTEADWKATQKAMASKPAFSPADGVQLFRPFDYADELGTDLMHKWGRLYENESRRSVMQATLESRAILTLNTRPDTLAAALLHSFSRYQTFSVTTGIAMTRAILAADTPMGIMKSIARIGLATIPLAALAIQLRNWSNNRPFEDMTKPVFWLKAFGSSGAGGMWGDYVTGAIRSPDSGQLVKRMGGPLVEEAADALAMLSSPIASMLINDKAYKWTASKAGIDFVDFMRKYMVPQPFFVGQVLQRDIMEPFQHYLDPKLMEQRWKGQRGYAASHGQPYAPNFGPGTSVPLIPRFGTGQ